MKDVFQSSPMRASESRERERASAKKSLQQIPASSKLAQDIFYEITFYVPGAVVCGRLTLFFNILYTDVCTATRRFSTWLNIQFHVKTTSNRANIY